MGPKLRTLVEYWHARCQDGRLPGRETINPCDLKLILPTMFIVDCPTRDDASWVYRLIGTHIVEQEGYDKTGRPVRDYFTGSVWPLLRREYLQCMEEHRPMYRADTAYNRLSRDTFDFERIFLPLASDGVHVDKIFGVVDYLPAGTIETRLTA